MAGVKRGRGNLGASLPLPFRTSVTQAILILASPAGVPRGSSRVPAPLTSADLSGKNQKGLMKGEDLTVLEQTTQLTHERLF